MAKQNYLGPDVMFRQRLRNHHRDLCAQIDRCAPLGPEYRALSELAERVSTTYLALYGEPVRSPMRPDVAGNGARGLSPP